VEAQGIFLLNASGKVVAMNEEARRILDIGDGLALERGRLVYSAPEPGPGGWTVIRRKSGMPGLLLREFGMAAARPDAPVRAIAVQDTASELERRVQICVEVYGFTPAEERLSRQVLAGASPFEAAERLQVSLENVRSYLKRLRYKAGVNSYTALLLALQTAGGPRRRR
jgi:DNA-binding CsgD family transcriptional regulator